MATARKMVTIIWHVLHRGEDYRHQIELPTNKKLRKMELIAGAQPRRGGDGRPRNPNREQRRAADLARAREAEKDYQQLVARTHGSAEQTTDTDRGT